MEWYLPITIIPGIGVLIVSTTNQMIAVSEEIRDITASDCNSFKKNIASLKITQLGKLTLATFFLYISCAFYVLSGIFAAFLSMHFLPDFFLILGTVCLFIAIGFLIAYGFNLIQIRKKQFQNLINNDDKK